MSIHPPAQGFSTAADDYDRGRPDYPPRAGRWLAHSLDLRPGRTVLDIAAGTGKLTRLLAGTGAMVVAVEPVAEMRARLAAALPAVESSNGTAEALPCQDASVDAATVGQAFHWFDGDRALAEIHRVVRPAGRLAVVYNRRTLDDPIHAGIEAIIGPLRGATPAHRTGRWRDAFENTKLWAAVEEVEFLHTQMLDREGLVARVSSTSFIARLPTDDRARVLDQVRGLVSNHATRIELPYVCELFLWQRVS